MPRGYRTFPSFDSFLAEVKKDNPDFRGKGPCWTCDKVVRTNRSRTGLQFAHPSGEREPHRILWKMIYPEDPIRGWSLTRGCWNEKCVNPAHFFKSFNRLRADDLAAQRSVPTTLAEEAQVSEATSVS